MIDFSTLKGMEIPEGKVKSIHIVEADGNAYDVEVMKTLITFTIICYSSSGGISQRWTYQAEEGMTWAKWCDSDYNTDDWECCGSGTSECVTLNGWEVDVAYNDVIKDNQTYEAKE